uniref:RING-type domain-containing protein n=1 Tax=Caenorhabditis japonica TaxID=281687 RepID=A0A8R1HY49_CAEJA
MTSSYSEKIIRVETNPALIDCGHSFCRFCIESHLNINEKCPLCRSHAGHPIKNRQLESLTMSYVASRNLSSDYFDRMQANQKRLLLQRRALVIIWTELNKQPTELCNLVKNIDDRELKSEIIRQVYQQDGIGLEHTGDLHRDPAATISLKNTSHH